MIRNVSPQAQQALAKAVCEEFSVNSKVILCHTPALLEPIEHCTLGTFDQIDERLLSCKDGSLHDVSWCSCELCELARDGF